jgi:protein-disulfide isomerase
MSRAYNARRKARRQAQAAAERARSGRPRALWPRLTALVPALLIAAVFAAVAVLGVGSSTGGSREQVREEVSALLAGLPQDGRALGSPKAPITLWMFADLECPTVKRFVEAYLPSIVETWVRNGTMKIEYRSLQTDTFNERTFFEQEMAALAAGRQDKMWNFLLTFLHQQGQEDTDYVTDEFIVDIASQVPGLGLRPWHRDREDALLSRQVALGVHTAHVNGMRSTPSFVISLASGQIGGSEDPDDVAGTKEEIESALRKVIHGLDEENLGDVPTLSPYLGGSRASNTG